jgi:hypothetical protein
MNSLQGVKIMKLYSAILFFLTICLLISPLSAQDESTETNVTYGGHIEGAINAGLPRTAFYFDGLRGEVISLKLEVTAGDLDPIVSIADVSGTLIARYDDTDGNRDVNIDSLVVPRSGRYFIIVSRFGLSLGSTSGTFELSVERIGVSSNSGSTLRYGDAIINNITNMIPQLYYSFHAEKGDIIDVIMQRNSGNLDPYLQVVNSQSFVLADNDDVIGSGSLDAAINGLVIEETGTYIIIATRYGEAAGVTSGRFILTLREAENSGLGNSAQTAIPIAVRDTVENELTSDRFIKYYVFQARQNDLVSVSMSRIRGSLDAFLAIADANLRELVTNDDGGGGQNAKIDNFLIPADGSYYIIATRLDREQGTTIGSYKLELQSLGNAFDGVPTGIQRITYGTTITGRVDGSTPEVVFAFYGEAGDAVTASLNRGDGDLDPVIQILNDSQSVVVQDDDGGDGQNARIARHVLLRSGIYYIRASRFTGTDGNPDTAGSFILVLARLTR